MSASFQDYIDTIRSGIYKTRIKIEWLHSDESVESELVSDVLSGNLTINRNNGVRRTVNVTFKYTKDLHPSVYGIWLRKKFRLSLGLETKNGDYFIQQGVFVLTNPVYTSEPTGGVVTISGIDKFCLLNGENGYGKLKDIYQIPVGSTPTFAITKILEDFKDTILPNLQITTQTFPYDVRKGYGDSVGDMLKEIAYFSARNIFYDEYGRFNFVDDVADDIKGSEWDFNDVNDKFTYLGSEIEYDFANVRNLIKVIGANVNGLIAIGEAKNEDLSSPTNISIVGEISEIITNNYIQTQVDAERLAKYILKQLIAINMSGSLSSVRMFHLNVDDVITITDSIHGFDMQRFIITGIDIDLSFGGDMSISIVKTDGEDFFVGKVGGS